MFVDEGKVSTYHLNEFTTVKEMNMHVKIKN